MAKPFAALALFLVATSLLFSTTAQATWTDGEVLGGQLEMAVDDMGDVTGTLREGLGQVQAAVGSALGMKNDVLGSLGSVASLAADDTVATVLGGQSTLSGLAQTALQTGNLLARRVAAGAGGAAQQLGEQPLGVVSAFGQGRALGSGALGQGAAYGVTPTVLSNTPTGADALSALAAGDELAAKDAAIAGLAIALAQQQQQVQQGEFATVGGDGGGGFAGGDGGPVIVAGGGGGGGGGAPVTVVSAAAGPTTAAAPPTATVSPAERRFFDAVSGTLSGALRAVPVVRGSAAAAAPPAAGAAAAVAAAPTAVQQMTAIPVGALPGPVYAGGYEDFATVPVAVPAGSTVIPAIYQEALPDYGFGGGGFYGGGGGFYGGGGGSGEVNVTTSTPVKVSTPVTVDTPVKQSSKQSEGARWNFGPPGLAALGGLAGGGEGRERGG